MNKDYRDIQGGTHMVNEPAATYGISERCHIPMDGRTDREHMMATTMPVDEYFDIPISKVHEDFGDSTLFEDAGMELPDGKDAYTPEELRMMLIDDLNELYGVRRAE